MTPDEQAEYRAVSKLLNHVLQRIEEAGLGKVWTAADTLAEHERRISELEKRQ